jgi:hypothetical protein
MTLNSAPMKAQASDRATTMATERVGTREGNESSSEDQEAAPGARTRSILRLKTPSSEGVPAAGPKKPAAQMREADTSAEPQPQKAAPAPTPNTRRKGPDTLASAVPNELETRARPGNLGVGEFVVPLSVASRYSAIDGRYFAKEGKRDPMREMFRDHGVRLSTSTTDKAAIADMVSLASAKQWKSVKLSGAQEFRHEAWLQAESQGIRTMGYTPRDADIAELRTLTNERSMNRIEPISSHGGEESRPVARAAPRANLDKNQAFLHTEAAKALASNAVALREALQGRAFEDVAKLAYWRGVVIEENRHQPAVVRSEVLARFDEQAREPGFLKTIEQQTHGTLDDKTIDRVERSIKREGHEQSL